MIMQSRKKQVPAETQPSNCNNINKYWLYSAILLFLDQKRNMEFSMDVDL